MNGESSRQFVDANVFVYAYDASAGQKKATAERLLAGLWETGAGCLSVQVLQEFFVTVTKKVNEPLSVEEAADRMRELTAWKVFAPSADDVLRAVALHRVAKVSFWDALVVHAAAELGCDVLWTEDLNDGQVIQGVRIRNPFLVDHPEPDAAGPEDASAQ